MTMTTIELKKKLEELNVPRSFYSINGDLSSDTYILNHVYNYWEYFYFDEKGRVMGYKRFESESEACNYFFQQLKTEIKYYQ